MRMLLIAALAAIPLAGCQTTDMNATAQKTLAYACPALQAAYTGIQGYQAAGGKLSAKDQSTVEAAYQTAAPICADPSKATAVDAIGVVLAETAVIARVLKKGA